MKSSSALAVLAVVVTLGLAACSGGGDAKPQPQDAGGETSSEGTCQGIRICVAMCADTDAVCAQACVARGSAAARTTYQALATCTTSFCAAGDFDCSCQQQCFAEGACLDQVDTCLAGAVDDLACMYCR